MSSDPPGWSLIAELDQLRLRLSDSGVERTQGLREAMGDDCEFFRRSLSKFLEKDYIDLRNQVRIINKLFEVIDGEG